MTELEPAPVLDSDLEDLAKIPAISILAQPPVSKLSSDQLHLPGAQSQQTQTYSVNETHHTHRFPDVLVSDMSDMAACRRI